MTTARLVALGASNLTRLALGVLDAARRRAGGPIEAHLALGHGRSYGIASRVLWRGLDGIDGCGLWPRLEQFAPAPTTGLLMDVGNDLVYGVPVPQTLAWVERSLARLRPHCDRLAVVGLPLASIATLTPRRFAVFRRIVLPSCRLELPAIGPLAAELHRGLAALADAHGATFHELPGAWYGLDPIHIRRRFARGAIAAWLGVGEGAPQPAPRLDTLPRRVALTFAAPDQRVLFGRRRQHPQPVRRWRDGTTLSLW